MRWVVVVALVGCYAPVPPEGAPCGEPPARACPTGQRCGPDNRCYRDPSDIDAPRGEGGLPIDAPSGACTPRHLLVGGQSAILQGWTIEGSGTRSINESGGLTTMSTAGGGHQLLVLANALPNARWGLAVQLQVMQSGGHAAGQASLAIMASYRAAMGDDADRKKMLWIDNDKVGWGDGTISIGAQMQQAATITLEPTTGGGLKATIAAGGGGGSFSTQSFTTNGTIAIGDQSLTTGLDSTFAISSIDLYCP